VPDVVSLLAQVVRDRKPRIVVAVAAGKHYDAESHGRFSV
jgi:hypothetical protein